jgi:hypothetical protein
MSNWTLLPVQRAVDFVIGHNIKRGEGGPPPRTPSAKHVCGVWRYTPGDGRNESGLRPHLVFILGGDS